jgi:ribosomal protein S18 acetylase RimI-like enzyme
MSDSYHNNSDPPADPAGGLIIRQLSASDSLEDMTALLHRAYRTLADMGLMFTATHQDSATTASRIEGGTAFLAEFRGEPVGTITYHPPGVRMISRLMPVPTIASVGQLAVDPEWQNRKIGRRLMVHAESHALSTGADGLVLDTAEPATHLISWYERMGYRFVQYVQWKVTNYRSVIMMKSLKNPS